MIPGQIVFCQARIYGDIPSNHSLPFHIMSGQPAQQYVKHQVIFFCLYVSLLRWLHYEGIQQIWWRPFIQWKNKNICSLTHLILKYNLLNIYNEAHLIYILKWIWLLENGHHTGDVHLPIINMSWFGIFSH